MSYKLKVDVEMEIIFDEKTGEFKILSSVPKIKSQIKMTEELLKMEYKLTETDVRYGIMTLGAKSTIGTELPQGTEIELQVHDEIFHSKTHKTSKGRIDGLMKIFKLYSFKEDDVLQLSYDLKTKKITIHLI